MLVKRTRRLSHVLMKTSLFLQTLLLMAAFFFCTGFGVTLATAAPKRVLVVSTTEGFRHSCIPLGNQILTALGQKSGAFTVDIVDVNPNDVVSKVNSNDPQFAGADGKPVRAKVDAARRQALTDANRAALAAKCNSDSLKNYDAVIFNCTTGDLPLPDKQAFLDWIKSGKAFIGIHAAGDTFDHHPGVDPYIEMLGGEFKTHGPQVGVECINQDPKHPATAHLGKSWTISQEEIYQFINYDPAKVHELLILEKHPDPANGAPGHFPVSWCKQYGQGRVFYTSLGHREDIWDPNWKDGSGNRRNPPEVAEAYQKHLLGGILWALGIEPGDATPQTAK